MIPLAIVTVSDRCAAGEREDRSGAVLAAWAVGGGFDVVHRRTVADCQVDVVRLLVELADRGDVRLILTTGGTGLGPRDITPEATRVVIEREAPGLAELLRSRAFPTVPTAALGRGIAGIRGGVLIINLPGSPRAVEEGLAVLAPILPHALAILAGETEH